MLNRISSFFTAKKHKNSNNFPFQHIKLINNETDFEIMVPILAYNGIALDNTCRTSAEMKKFFNKDTYVNGLYLDNGDNYKNEITKFREWLRQNRNVADKNLRNKLLIKLERYELILDKIADFTDTTVQHRLISSKIGHNNLYPTSFSLHDPYNWRTLQYISKIKFNSPFSMNGIEKLVKHDAVNTSKIKELKDYAENTIQKLNGITFESKQEELAYVIQAMAETHREFHSNKTPALQLPEDVEKSLIASLSKLVEQGKNPISYCLESGYNLSELKRAGIKASDLKKINIPPESLIASGYARDEIGNFSIDNDELSSVKTQKFTDSFPINISSYNSSNYINENRKVAFDHYISYWENIGLDDYDLNELAEMVYNMHFASINIIEENDLLRKIINNYSKNPKKYSEYINVLIQLILSRIIILLDERGSKRAQSLANISGSGKNDLINTIFKNLDQEQPCVITTICNWSQDQLNIDISRDDIQEIYDKVNLIWNVITAGEFNGNHGSSGAPHLDEFIFKGSSKGNFEVINGKLSVEAARLFYLSGYSHTRNMSGYQDLINVTVYDFKDNSDFFQVLRLQEPTTHQDKLTALLQDYLDSNKDSEIDLDIISNILPVMDNNNKNIFSERVKDLVLIRYKMDSGCKNSIRNIVPHLNIDHQKNITSQYPELHKNSIFLNPCFLSASISISCFLGMLFSSMYSSTAANLVSKIVSLKMATVSGLPILHILIISILLFSLLTLTLKFISKRPPTEIKHMTDIRPEAGTKLMSEYGGININTTEVNAHNRYDSKKKAANIGLERLTSYS